LLSNFPVGHLASGLIYPFFITLTLIIALRMIGLGRAAGVALPLALFLTQKLATSIWFPPFEPPDFRAFYMMLAAGALGAVLDFGRAGAVASRCVLVLWPLVVMAVLAGQRLSAERAEDPLLLVVFCVVGIAVLLRLDQARRRDADAPIMLAASCGFASVVSLAWGITTTVTPFAALGAACLAFAALSFGRLPGPFTLAALLTGGGAWLGLMATIVLHAALPRLSFLLLLLPFAADLAWRQPVAGRLRWLRAGVIGALAGLPGLAAVFYTLP
jgi:hypothetical protein